MQSQGGEREEGDLVPFITSAQVLQAWPRNIGGEKGRNRHRSLIDKQRHGSKAYCDLYLRGIYYKALKKPGGCDGVGRRGDTTPPPHGFFFFVPTTPTHPQPASGIPPARRTPKLETSSRTLGRSSLKTWSAWTTRQGVSKSPEEGERRVRTKHLVYPHINKKEVEPRKRQRVIKKEKIISCTSFGKTHRSVRHGGNVH